MEAELNHPQHHAFDVGFINRVQQTIDRMEAAKTSDFIIENYVQDMFRYSRPLMAAGGGPPRPDS